MKKTFDAVNLIHNGRFIHLYEDAEEDKKAYLVKRVGELSAELKKYQSKQSSLYMYFCNITSSIASFEYDLAHGVARENSLKEMELYMKDFMTPDKEKYQQMFQKKWLWPIIRILIPKIMLKVNGEGFHTIAPKNKDKKTIIFYTNRCMFHTVLKEKGMLDLARVFCSMDEYMYGDIPGVKFIRLGTLCSGAECCDFKFFKK